MIKNTGVNSIPHIYVDRIESDKTLVLKHEHDGRDLELSFANRVYDHICYLWNDDVAFTTIIEGEPWEF